MEECEYEMVNIEDKPGLDEKEKKHKGRLVEVKLNRKSEEYLKLVLYLQTIFYVTYRNINSIRVCIQPKDWESNKKSLYALEKLN